MHRPAEAAQELKRAVKELGLVGAILNDWQATDEFDGNGILLFDGKEFDPFWEAVEELGVPVYFHPKVSLAFLKVWTLFGRSCVYSALYRRSDLHFRFFRTAYCVSG